jgi:hypothetical protein
MKLKEEVYRLGAPFIPLKELETKNYWLSLA